MIDKYINLKNVVSVIVVHEKTADYLVLEEVEKIKWKIFPIWFERLKINKWVDHSGFFRERCYNTIQEVIEGECRFDTKLRYDENENKFIETPYIRLTYTDKTYDKISFESEDEMNKRLKTYLKLNSDMVKIKENNQYL